MPDPLDPGACLGELCDCCPQHDASLVAKVSSLETRSTLSNMKGGNAALFAEVQELAHMLAVVRADIAALGADDIRASHIPSATDELDAIVAHTATATNSIIECCEQLEEVVHGLHPSTRPVVTDIVTQIYEACGFQDITGQRVTKVVTTLKIIEAKVDQMLEVFAADRSSSSATFACGVSGQSLLNGPQLSTVAMDQADIDALMASLD